MKKFTALCATLIIGASLLDAHDMFLKLRSYIVEPNTNLTIAL